jgi:hypothetical protein
MDITRTSDITYSASWEFTEVTALIGILDKIFFSHGHLGHTRHGNNEQPSSVSILISHLRYPGTLHCLEIPAQDILNMEIFK